MRPEELIRDLAAGPPLPAYLLAGSEPLLRDDALAALRDAVLAGGPRDFNFERLEADKTSPAALADAVRTLPVMAPYRLVTLRDPDGARGAGRGLVDALPDLVAELQADGQNEGRSVLVVASEKADKRARWVKAFGAAATVECQPPKGQREVVAFIRAEASRQEVAIAKGVAELLAERIGPQLMMLRQEVAKASLLAGPGETVARAHVAAGASDIAEEPIWDLTDAIGAGRTPDALVVLSRLQRAGAAAPVLLGALASHFRRLVRTRSGAPVGGPPFVRKKLESQARRYSPARLRACLDAIHQTDVAIKGAGALSPEMALERLVIGLAG